MALGTPSGATDLSTISRKAMLREAGLTDRTPNRTSGHASPSQESAMRICDYSTFPSLAQGGIVRGPTHTIQFMRYSYTEYVRKTLQLAGVNLDRVGHSLYETWTPYISGQSENRLQGAEEVESRDCENGSPTVPER
jgi:hypothetical protein